MFVEWDEPGSGDKQNRVSPWEIETPESLFMFPSLTSGLKRPLQLGAQADWENMINRPFIRVPDILNGDLAYPSISSIWSEELIKRLIKPQSVDHPGKIAPAIQDPTLKAAPSQEAKILMQPAIKQKLQPSENMPPQSAQHPQFPVDRPNTINPNFPLQTNLPRKLQPPNKLGNQASSGTNTDMNNSELILAADQLSQITSCVGQCNEDKLGVKPINPHSLINELAFLDQNHGSSQLQTSSWLTQAQLDANILPTEQIDASQLESATLNGLFQYSDTIEWNAYSSTSQSLAGSFRSLESSIGHEMWDHQMNNSRCLSQSNHLVPLPQQDLPSFHGTSKFNNFKDLSDESHSQSDIYSCFNFDGSSGGSTVVDPSVSSTVLDEFCALKDADFQNASDYLVGNFSSSQDVQSQITSASLADSQAFCVQEFADNSGGASSRNVDFDDTSLLQNSSWQQVTPRVRTYTKIQKAGSVGRSIDISSFKNYDELCSEIERMFGLEGLLNDSRGSGWKLVYVDFENDVLLVGDDPWEEFVGCVRCIRILSPAEVQQMGEEGMQLLNSTMQGINSSVSEGGRWDAPI
ncbi:unnamed protein product [Ilex paraguariensis]|uniref:Auxin-responsive protein n=1 Tax=Ilex paraguariensis TaxID=185542 RepID=A0ABC8S1R3_9AQUA